MPNQELERDQLFRVLAIQLGLLDAARLDQLGKEPGQSRGDSIASLILERAGLSEHDQQGLRWLVERTLAIQQVATNDRSMESTGATGQHTPASPEESGFLSTIIERLPQQSIISSATLLPMFCVTPRLDRLTTVPLSEPLLSCLRNRRTDKMVKLDLVAISIRWVSSFMKF